MVEIFASHDIYEWELAGRNRKDYESERFTAHYPTAQTSKESSTSDERVQVARKLASEAERERDRAAEAKRQARADHDEALRLADAKERETLDLAMKIESQNGDLLSLEKELSWFNDEAREREAWSFLRREGWALRGS